MQTRSWELRQVNRKQKNDNRGRLKVDTKIGTKTGGTKMKDCEPRQGKRRHYKVSEVGGVKTMRTEVG